MKKTKPEIHIYKVTLKVEEPARLYRVYYKTRNQKNKIKKYYKDFYAPDEFEAFHKGIYWHEHGTFPNTEFVVVSRKVNDPTIVKFGRYAEVAVLEVDADRGGEYAFLRMAKGAPGVVRIVEYYGRQSIGRSLNCAWSRTKLEADALAAKLNKRKKK